MSVTQQNVAEKLGITRSLVCKALSGHPRVSEATRQRVIDVASEMGYDSGSNTEARRLIARRYGRRARTFTLALIAPGLTSLEESRSMPFFSPFYAGAEDEAMASELDVIACRPYRDALPKAITRGGIDGIVALTDVEALKDLSTLGIPVVSLELDLPGSTSILPDERTGMELLVRNLIKLGHRDIAYVSLRADTQQSINRFAGYKHGLKSASLPYRKELVDISLTGMDEAGEAAVQLYERLRHRPYSALICYNDWMAMSAVRALQARGISVPGDVSVAGFDDVSPDYRFEPKLTSIAYDRYAMARRAVQIVLQAIEEDRACEDKKEIFPVKLVVSQSTAPPRKRRSHRPK